MRQDDVRGRELMRHVGEFAKRIKLSGSKEELESFHYLRAQLDGLGYRTRLISHDAYISLPGASRVTIGNQALRSITHSFSLTSPDAGTRGALVDLGEGRARDFAAQDLRGRIVLVDGIASPAVAARAAEAGATGQLHVSPHEHLHEMCISPVWGSPSAETRDALPQTVTCTISEADGAAIRERLRAGELVEAVLHAEVDTGWRKTPILEASLDPDGAAVDAPFVLFSGHHDTWYYGVMDNGSANATMLESARALAADRAAWRRGLRLCFWSGHSHGRYSGSTWYVDHHWDELERRCAVHVNVDSTGGTGATVLTDSAVSSQLAGLAATVIRDETGQEHAGTRNSRSSDASFWGVGVPSMFGSLSMQPKGPVKMRNALGWWWHTPEDLIDKIDEDFLVRDTRIFVRTLHRLLTDRVLPLDHGAAVDELLDELRNLAPLTEDGAPLAASIAAAETLRGGLRRLAGIADAARVDQALIGISRALVPLDYTIGDRFSHDPALPQPAWPALRKLRDYAEAEPDTDEWRFRAVSAVRSANRLLHALRQANAALDAALSGEAGQGT